MQAGPPPSIAHPKHVDAKVVWLFYGGGALVALVLAATALWTPAPFGSQQRGWMAILGVGQAVAFIVSAQVALRLRVGLAALMSGLTAIVAVTVAALMTSMDASLLLMGLLGYVVCLCGLFAGRAAGLTLGAASVGAIAVVTTLRPGHSVLAVVNLLMLVATGLLIGVLSHVTLTRTLGALRQREQRFQGLLNIAADWYWELDDQLRYTRLSLTDDKNDKGSAMPQAIGKLPWEAPNLGPGPEVWKAHREQLDRREPFRNFIAVRPNGRGGAEHVSASGEPVFDAEGRFKGYWGVTRVVTAEVEAERALQHLAQRYRQLFERSPTPMVAHRRGRVIGANEAAAVLLGYDDADAIRGAELLARYEDAERERALARLVDLDGLPEGGRLPLTEFRLRRLDGTPVQATVTSLRIRLDDGPAVLSIYQDVTARKTAEQALRHSQTLLSQLFDTTPDVVTLVEYTTGRYLMINDRFTQVLGWSRDAVIGRSTEELGIYNDMAARHEMRRLLVQHGSLRDKLIMFRTRLRVAVPLRVSAALMNFDGVDYVVAVGRDVSQTEQTRQEHEAILKYASVGISFTRDRRFVQVNPRFEEMFGWSIGSLAGQPGSVVWLNENDYAEIGRVAGPLLAAGKPFESECFMARRDGSGFWCRLSARVIDPGEPARGGTIWIAEDITERRMVQESLAAARDAAEAASRAKSAFLANTSHEIRTPLNGLLGLARLARRPELPDEERQRYLDQILDSARTLSGVITDILDLSKIEAGRLSVETVPFDLRALLDALCDSTEALAQARGLKLRREIDADLPAAVRGDPLRLRQIIGNFLNNALKFTERGEIKLSARRGPGELVHVIVADTGPGIDEATQTRLFRPFVQADDSTTRRYGGTGLGLSICRELATLMGGAVGVDSQPRRGSRFWADLPLPAVDVADLGGADPSGFDEPVAGARVLVVEDNAVNLLIVRAMLEGWGIEVVEAGDGQQALDAVARGAREGEPFDAVLMDVQMPVMSGHDAARALRRRPEGAGLPIVALTAAALVSERDQALAAGMDAFLTKPIDAGQLRQTLARLLGGRVRF